jgi:hypothetical protein
MTPGEVAEATVVTCNQFSTPNHDPNCKREHLRLKYAFVQPGFMSTDEKTGTCKIFEGAHFWHVMSDGPFHHSTLSMQGLKEWKLL